MIEYKKQWIAIENWMYAVIRPGQLLFYNGFFSLRA
jgi:hypothetical protein